MNTLQEKITQEINTLPISSQKEVLDFALFLKSAANKETECIGHSRAGVSKQPGRYSVPSQSKKCIFHP